ncbi:MAG: MMPL family transporter, partial [Myxococcales bacterium]|nr:MMPL family transporter [Myxococcales bacterium]
ALALALQLRIDQQLRALLPDDARSTARIDALSERLGNQSELYVTVRSPSREASLAFAEELAEALRGRPELRYALFHLDRAFFEKNALLYADLEDLLDLRCRVIDRIRAEVRKEMALFPEDEGGEGVKAADEALGENELRERYELDTRLPEYYETPTDDGVLFVIKARPTGSDTDIAFARQLFKVVEETAADLHPEHHHPAMEVGIEGSYAEQSRRVGGLQGDIVRGSAIVVGLLMLVLAAYFRGLRAIVLILVPLLIAVVTALGIARLLFGELNLVSAFIFVVLLGLGIDFGIHVLGRYRDERRRGLGVNEALAVTMSTTSVSTFAGGLSTALTCFLLIVADFRGFSQFGIVAGIGVLLALLGAIVVLPALVVIFERIWPWRAAAPKQVAEAVEAAEAAAAAPAGRGRFPWIAGLIVAASLGAAALAGSHLGDLEFEYDLGRLDEPVEKPPAGTKAKKSGHEPYRKAVGRKTTLAPAVALTADLEQTADVHRQLAALTRLSADEAEILASGGELPLPPAFDGCGHTLDPNDADGDGASAEDVDDGDVDGDGDDAGAAGTDEGEDEVIDEEEDDVRDPAFLALAARARQHRAIDPEVRELLRRYPGDRLRDMHDRLYDLASVYSFVPELQAEKLAVIRDIRQRIRDKAGVLSAADQERLKTWEPYLEVDAPVSADDLPEWVRLQFTDEAGELGRFVVFWTKGAKSDYRNSKRIYDAYRELETRSGEAPVAASFFVIPEIVDTIRGDGPVVLGLSGGVLVVIALLLFRRLSSALLVLGTVSLALVWLGGILWLQDWKVNFFNVIAFPLLIGMGQDDAIHILHRSREGARLGVVLRETGGAILMTTVTTVLGYGGMVFADHLGLYSLGFTAATGMTLCFVASVATLPATLRLLRWIRGR